MVDTPLRIVIVGGVAGGASAATRARRMNERAEIILFERGKHVSFANCGLPYYLGGEITERQKLLVATPEFLTRRFRLDVRTEHEVLAIDRAARTVTVRDHTRGRTFGQPYDKLILAPGAVPIVPPLAGIEAPNVFVLRNVSDTDAIQAAMAHCAPRRAVVVGAGFIGLEMVEQLVRQGFEVALVELQGQVLPQLDPEMARPLQGALHQAGVAVHLGSGLQRVVTDGNGVATSVELADGTRLEASLVVLGIGVRPNIELAVAAGLELGPDGGIGTNDCRQTSDPNVYAVGDAAQYRCGVTGRALRMPLAGPANRSGRLAGEHAATDACRPMAPVLGTAIVRVFERVAALTGLTVSQARRLDRAVQSVTVVAGDHAEYYPGAVPMTLKLVYDPADGRVLGGQAVGGQGVDKRIDVLATAIGLKATVGDLAGLDLAYAPPFGSAKDPVHLAAFAACNQLDGITTFVDADADLSGMQVLDVRMPSEIAALPFRGVEATVEIPLDVLRDHLDRLDPARPTAVTCQAGFRAHAAARILEQSGFEQVVVVVSGGALVRDQAVGSS